MPSKLKMYAIVAAVIAAIVIVYLGRGLVNAEGVDSSFDRLQCRPFPDSIKPF